MGHPVDLHAYTLHAYWNYMLCRILDTNDTPTFTCSTLLTDGTQAEFSFADWMIMVWVNERNNEIIPSRNNILKSAGYCIISGYSFLGVGKTRSRMKKACFVW